MCYRESHPGSGSTGCGLRVCGSRCASLVEDYDGVPGPAAVH